MNEREFREQYAALQERVAVSPELKRATAECTGRAARPAPRKRADARPSRPAAKRWVRAAACLLAGALAIAGTPALPGLFRGANESGIALDEAAEKSGFSVRAYASDGSSVLSPGEGDVVVFDRDMGYRLMGSEDYQASGFFSGCLFHVEGEGIARVQANLTGGALYRTVFEDVPDTESERSRELASWKPTSRGTGDYYGGYDLVMAQTVDGQMKVGLTKLWGSTIDLRVQDDPGIADGSTLFGFWTNEGDAPEEDPVVDDPLSSLMDRFEGQRLTITVTFEDGRTSTQVIELHVGTFRIKRTEGGAVEVTTERATEEDIERAEAAKSLFGEVVEAGDRAFPLPLDEANDRADEVLPAGVIERQDNLVRATREADGRRVDATLSEDSLVSADEMLTFDNPWEDYVTGEMRTSSLEMSDVSVEALDALPEGTDLASCAFVEHGWLGNLSYMDKCAREVWGYGHNDDGTLSGGTHRFALVSVTVRNPGDEAVLIWPRSGVLLELAVRHDDGTYDLVRGGYDLDFTASGDASVSEDHPQNVVLAPSGEARITLLRAAPASALSDEGLCLVPNRNPGSDPAAFALGVQE